MKGSAISLTICILVSRYLYIHKPLSSLYSIVLGRDGTRTHWKKAISTVDAIPGLIMLSLQWWTNRFLVVGAAKVLIRG